MTDTRLSLYWFDSSANVVMKADPDYGTGKVFYDPVTVGPIPAQGTLPITSVTRLRTGGQTYVYWISLGGKIWGCAGDVPNPDTGVEVTGLSGDIAQITTFGDLTGNGNEDLICLRQNIAPPGFLRPYLYENQGSGKFGPEQYPGIADVVITSGTPIAGRGDNPLGTGPWVFGGGNLRTPTLLTLNKGSRGSDSKVVFTESGAVQLLAPKGCIPVSVMSLGDSDGDGIPDLIVGLYSYRTSKVQMGLASYLNEMDRMLIYRPLDNLGTTNSGNIMF